MNAAPTARPSGSNAAGDAKAAAPGGDTVPRHDLPRPLTGLRIVELGGIGPAPFCGMLLADLGADVVRLVRPSATLETRGADAVLDRGKRRVEIDLKSADGADLALRMIDQADAVFEGYRPQVMERLGLGPDVLLERNPRLVYGRVTGWGQAGPLALKPGHDGNYIALTGALNAIGPGTKPAFPLNLVGDYGGGGLFLALGLVSAVMAARQNGQGQVIDCAMTDGSAVLLAPFYGLLSSGHWENARQSNNVDGGAPHYNLYQCQDGRWVSICCLEKPFYETLLDSLGIDRAAYPYPPARQSWEDLAAELTTIFSSQPLVHWCQLLEGAEVCFAPVLDMIEAPEHPHNAARQTYLTVDGIVQPAPAPRFSATTINMPIAPKDVGAMTVIDEWEEAR